MRRKRATVELFEEIRREYEHGVGTVKGVAHWNAVAKAPLKAGERVRVTAIDRLNVTVEPIENQLRG